MSDEILTVKKDNVLAAAKECDEAKRILAKVFPDAFEDEWIEVTKLCKLWSDSIQGKLKIEPPGIGLAQFEILARNIMPTSSNTSGKYKTENGNIYMRKE